MFTVSFIFVCPACFADVALTPKSTVHFSTVAEGRRILATADEFVTRLSPFDRAARLQTDKVVSQKQYIDFVKQHVIPWTKEEIENIESVLESLGEKLARLEVDLPPKIDFIKTTGRDYPSGRQIKNADAAARASFGARDFPHFVSPRQRVARAALCRDWV
jgi:hypothetical protein